MVRRWSRADNRAIGYLARALGPNPTIDYATFPSADLRVAAVWWPFERDTALGLATAWGESGEPPDQEDRVIKQLLAFEVARNPADRPAFHDQQAAAVALEQRRRAAGGEGPLEPEPPPPFPYAELAIPEWAAARRMLLAYAHDAASVEGWGEDLSPALERFAVYLLTSSLPPPCLAVQELARMSELLEGVRRDLRHDEEPSAG